VRKYEKKCKEDKWHVLKYSDVAQGGGLEGTVFPPSNTGTGTGILFHAIPGHNSYAAVLLVN
jgi:hypothetical protein